MMRMTQHRTEDEQMLKKLWPTRAAFVRSCGGNELLQLQKMAPSEKPSWEAQTRSESTSCTLN